MSQGGGPKSLPPSPQKESPLQTPGSRTRSLQDSEQYVSIKPPRCGAVLQHPQQAGALLAAVTLVHSALCTSEGVVLEEDSLFHLPSQVPQLFRSFWGHRLWPAHTCLAISGCPSPWGKMLRGYI